MGTKRKATGRCNRTKVQTQVERVKVPDELLGRFLYYIWFYRFFLKLYIKFYFIIQTIAMSKNESIDRIWHISIRP